MWNQLRNEVDIDELMKLYTSFHDSCIKQVFIRNREFVDDELDMSFDNISLIRLLFQRQALNLSAIELQFEDVNEFNWLHDNSSASVESAIIFQAVLEYQDGLIYWADDTDWRSPGADKTNFRWLSAKTAKWRVVEGGLGQADIPINFH